MLIGGKPVKTRSRPGAPGEVLEVDLPDGASAATTPAPDPSVDFAVVYVDDDLIVVDKPAGPWSCIPAPATSRAPSSTGCWPVPGAGGHRPRPGASDRPGIVHRLDKGTSGLLVVARTSVARRALTAQLAERTVERRYSALVWGAGRVDEGLIDAPLQRAEADRPAWRSGLEGGRRGPGIRSSTATTAPSM